MPPSKNNGVAVISLRGHTVRFRVGPNDTPAEVGAKVDKAMQHLVSLTRTEL